MNAEDASNLRRPVRKSVSRQVWHHDIEGIRRPSAVRSWIGEHRNYLREPVKRVWIAVRQDERKRMGSLAALVDKVDADIIDQALEVSEPIEFRLLSASVVAVLPIGDESAEIIEVDACVPGRAFHLVRPSRVLKPLRQIAQHLVSNVDPEPVDLVGSHKAAFGYLRRAETPSTARKRPFPCR
jgi:hypothetical protein